MTVEGIEQCTRAVSLDAKDRGNTVLWEEDFNFEVEDVDIAKLEVELCKVGDFMTGETASLGKASSSLAFLSDMTLQTFSMVLTEERGDESPLGTTGRRSQKKNIKVSAPMGPVVDLRCQYLTFDERERRRISAAERQELEERERTEEAERSIQASVELKERERALRLRKRAEMERKAALANVSTASSLDSESVNRIIESNKARERLNEILPKAFALRRQIKRTEARVRKLVRELHGLNEYIGSPGAQEFSQWLYAQFVEPPDVSSSTSSTLDEPPPEVRFGPAPGAPNTSMELHFFGGPLGVTGSCYSYEEQMTVKGRIKDIVKELNELVPQLKRQRMEDSEHTREALQLEEYLAQLSLSNSLRRSPTRHSSRHSSSVGSIV
eukprot:CAMPEP_0184664164 /NCGR_PEP_ID=MMETSP0308-20130426/51543_1 /TAXON_ID=38269 /ORGANISM="Gloeochaete witrockiana, Strain SAG 46.84" /LENGTH=382 /DNA_ID=CAMNT_0027107365 /DNA_START=240 /DNA_END=1388 /DNA_ORIENTATION=+